MNYLSDLLKLLGSTIPVLIGFLYYIGRRFTESYYETMDIPSNSLDFSTADYLSKSMQSWMFLLAIVLTYLVFILWRSIIKPTKPVLDTKKIVETKKGKANIFKCFCSLIKRIFKPQKGDPQYFGLIFFFYSTVTILLLIAWILPTAESNFAAEAIGEIVIVTFSIGLGLLIMTDEPTIRFIRDRKRLMLLFISSIVLSIIVTIQVLPHGIGRFVGILQSSPNRIEQTFPSIKLAVDKPLLNQDIEWEYKNGVYETHDRLIFIYENNEGIFIKEIIEKEVSELFIVKEASNTYYIPKSNIIGLDIKIAGDLSDLNMIE